MIQADKERCALQLDTNSDMDSTHSDASEVTFVRRPGSGRRKQQAPWRSPWDASISTEFSDTPPSSATSRPIKLGHDHAGASSAAAAAAAAKAAATVAAPAFAAVPTDLRMQCGSLRAASAIVRRGKGKHELAGPCCHCAASSSPQWRKGPKGKPILCNACGIRFLRTRSLGKVSPKKRRGGGGAAVSGGAGSAVSAAKRAKLGETEDTEDGEDGRTSSADGNLFSFEELPPPEAETEEPTDEAHDDVIAIHPHLAAAQAAAEAAAAAAAAADLERAASANAPHARWQQQQHQHASRFRPPVIALPSAFAAAAGSQAAGEGQGSAPSSPAVSPLMAPLEMAAVAPASLTSCVRLLAAGGGGGAALAPLARAASAGEPGGVVVQRSRSKGPAATIRLA